MDGREAVREVTRREVATSGAVCLPPPCCQCLNLGAWRVWASVSGEQCSAQSGCSDNNSLSLLHSDMKSEKRAPSPDVIVLSDNEQPMSPRVNGLPKEALQETSTEALMVSLVPILGTTTPNGIPECSC